MFDINGPEFLILLVVAVVVLGPERLPQYAAQLAKMVRAARSFAMSARDQVKAEMGDQFEDVDWQVLDPRRYDPRRIVRDALLDGQDDPFGIKGTFSNGSTNGSSTTSGTTASTSSAGTDSNDGAAGDAPGDTPTTTGRSAPGPAAGSQAFDSDAT